MTKQKNIQSVIYKCNAHAPLYVYREHHLNINKKQFCKIFNEEMQPDSKMHQMRLMRLENLETVMISDRDKALILTFLKKHGLPKLKKNALQVIEEQYIPLGMSVGEE